jgi:hypothetical protein
MPHIPKPERQLPNLPLLLHHSLTTHITTRGWCSGNRISCIGCVCKTSKERKEERSGKLELSTGCHARARSCDADVTTSPL